MNGTCWRPAEAAPPHTTYMQRSVLTAQFPVAAKIPGGTDGVGPGRTQQAFVFSLKADMTEYYRLIAVLGAQLNLDSERAGGGEGAGGFAGGGTEGLTLKRLAVWVADPLERLKQMATLVSAAAQLKVGNDECQRCIAAFRLLLLCDQ